MQSHARLYSADFSLREADKIPRLDRRGECYTMNWQLQTQEGLMSRALSTTPARTACGGSTGARDPAGGGDTHGIIQRQPHADIFIDHQEE